MTSFKPMLAKEADLDKVKYPLIVQPKLDGIRASVVDGKLVSRTLKSIPNTEIRTALSRPEFEGLDGELIVGDPTADDCYRRTSSFVMAQDKTGEPWSFLVFDMWNTGSQHYSVRWHTANDICERYKHTDLPIFMVTGQRADDAAELEAMEGIIVSAGYEGVIARVENAPYKFGRSGKTGPLLKIKRFIDFEAIVTGVFEEQHNANVAVRNALGRTERSTAQAGKVGKGTLGGLIVKAINGPAVGVSFRVGTGFDAAQRQALWAEWQANPFNGRIAKVKSFPIGVKDKPRHPVFLGWRDLGLDG